MICATQVELYHQGSPALVSQEDAEVVFLVLSLCRDAPNPGQKVWGAMRV